jgi:hypothetical protein
VAAQVPEHRSEVLAAQARAERNAAFFAVNDVSMLLNREFILNFREDPDSMQRHMLRPGLQISQHCLQVAAGFSE